MGCQPLTAGLVKLLAGEPAAAERVLRRGYERALRVGGAGPLANLGTMLARALLRQGRDEEAEAVVVRCRTAPPSQLDVHIRARGIESVLLARRRAHAAAQRLAAEAVRLAERSEQLDTQAAALMDMAEVHRIGDRPQEARTAARRASACYEAKGNRIGTAEVERFLTLLDGAPPPSSAS